MARLHKQLFSWPTPFIEAPILNLLPNSGEPSAWCAAGALCRTASVSVADEASAAQLAVVRRTEFFPVRQESETGNQGLEAWILPE